MLCWRSDLSLLPAGDSGGGARLPMAVCLCHGFCCLGVYEIGTGVSMQTSWNDPVVGMTVMMQLRRAAMHLATYHETLCFSLQLMFVHTCLAFNPPSAVAACCSPSIAAQMHRSDTRQESCRRTCGYNGSAVVPSNAPVRTLTKHKPSDMILSVQRQLRA